MQIYPRTLYHKISYSVTNARLYKKYMAFLKTAFIKRSMIGIHDDSTKDPLLAISKDRKQGVTLYSQGNFIMDMYFRQVICTQTNLSFISNNQSFYNLKKGYLTFKTAIEYLPLTHTQQYLKSPGKYYFKFITTTVYKKDFIVKLGFFGTHLGRYCANNQIRKIG